MAKKKEDKSVKADEGSSAKKKRGLFSFLRRKSKKDVVVEPDVQDEASKNDGSQDAPQDAPLAPEEPLEETSKAKKKPAQRSSSKKAPAQEKSASAKKPAAKSTTGTATKSSAQDKEAQPTKKRGRAAKKQVVEENNAALDEHLDDDAPTEKGNKKGLFGFLKRKKARSAPENKEPASDKKETAEDEEAPKKVKKGLFGFLKRSKKAAKDEGAAKEKKAEDTVEDALLASITGIDVSGNATNPGNAAEDDAAEDDEVAPPKKSKFGFLKKKIVIILLAAFGVTGASGAAAIVFVGPMFAEDIVKSGMACDVVHRANFELMQEKRITAFLRTDFLTPPERIKMLIQYTKLLHSEHPETNLFTVSMLDRNGPTLRAEFRGQNIGAQLVYAPNPLLSQATNKVWEVRYVNSNGVDAGKFIGDRFTLSEEEIDELNDESLVAADCYVAPVEGEDEEMAEEALDGAETDPTEPLEGEATLEGEDGMAEDGDAMEEEPAEPGFIDNMLAMVGLGGGDEEPAEGGPEGAEAMADGQDMKADPDMFPGDRQAHADVMEEDPGFFEGILTMVGLGEEAENPVAEILRPKVLGTKVRYD